MPSERSDSLHSLQWPHTRIWRRWQQNPHCLQPTKPSSEPLATQSALPPRPGPAPRGCIPRSSPTRFPVPGAGPRLPDAVLPGRAARARGAAAGAGTATHHQEEEDERRDAAGLGRGPHAAAAAQEAAAAPRGVALPAAARPGRPRRHGCGRSGFLEEGLEQRRAAPRAAAAGAERRARLGRGGIRSRGGRAASERQSAGARQEASAPAPSLRLRSSAAARRPPRSARRALSRPEAAAAELPSRTRGVPPPPWPGCSARSSSSAASWPWWGPPSTPSTSGRCYCPRSTVSARSKAGERAGPAGLRGLCKIDVKLGVVWSQGDPALLAATGLCVTYGRSVKRRTGKPWDAPVAARSGSRASAPAKPGRGACGCDAPHRPFTFVRANEALPQRCTRLLWRGF